MNKEAIAAVHEIRDLVQKVREDSHSFMQGDARFRVARYLNEIGDGLNKIYASCLKCTDEDRRDE